MKRQGFTLIELLVVIAIIAILAAILFPVFARAREKARQTSCLSNVKQLMLGVHMYAQDFDEYFVSSWYSGGLAYPGLYQWDGAITPYIKNTQIFRCPSVPTQSRGYAINVCYYGGSGVSGISANSPYGKPMAYIQDASGTIFLIDHTGGFEYGWQYISNQWTTYTNWTNRHNEGLNVGFCDGHAKWQKREDLFRKNANNVMVMHTYQAD